jgi:hypothetical protein
LSVQGEEDYGGKKVKITLPLTVIIPRKTKENKVFALNLNIYRNANFHTLNDAKIAWKQLVFDEVAREVILPPMPFEFVYTVYPQNNRKFDLANILSVVQKFTDDALVEMGVIPDDSYKVIPAINYRFGGVDKANPRCELEITAFGG